MIQPRIQFLEERTIERVIDEALYKALTNDKMAGAGVDVFQPQNNRYC